MKKQIVLILILMGLLMTFACEKNELEENSKSFSDDLLSQFISSEDINQLFTQNISFCDMGNISIEESRIETILIDNEEHFFINVAICKKNKITGQIIGIRLPDKSKKLNTNHSYVMALRDFREFNIETKSGIVRDYDLNYDGYNCGYIIVLSGL